jgi:hypothetical protein
MASTLIGQVLVEMGFATPEQINQALQRQALADPAHGAQLLGEILIDMGVVTDDQVRQALEAQGKTVVPHRA